MHRPNTETLINNLRWICPQQRYLGRFDTFLLSLYTVHAPDYSHVPQPWHNYCPLATAYQPCLSPHFLGMPQLSFMSQSPFTLYFQSLICTIYGLDQALGRGVVLGLVLTTLMIEPHCTQLHAHPYTRTLAGRYLICVLILWSSLLTSFMMPSSLHCCCMDVTHHQKCSIFTRVMLCHNNLA